MFVFAITTAAPAVAPFPTTPEGAAKRAVYAAASGVTVARVNRAGPFAAVLLHGGMMEGSPVDAPILVERFSFGWQALEELNFRCRLDDHVATQARRRALMTGMPAPQDEAACGGERDAGPIADIEALRKRSTAPLVPSVVVSGGFAMRSWYGGGGGETLYRRAASGWVRVLGGGGAHSASELRAAGVPAASVCVFAPWDVPCRKRGR